MDRQDNDAYITLLTTNSYLPGVMVLAHSLRDNGTKKKLACMVALDVLSGELVSELRTVYDHVVPVERVTTRRPTNLYMMDRPDLDSAFTKISLWSQTQYRKIVYIDADVVALRAPDELFDLEAPFSAAPDIGWPDCFNSGVMALTPNLGDYYALKALADRGISFDGADQGLLNMHFRNYSRISFAYNCTPSGNYQYVPAYRHFGSTISLVHFIGKDKPWKIGRGDHDATGVYQELLGRWWAQYDRHYRVPTKAVISGQGPPNARLIHQHISEDQDIHGRLNTSSMPTIQAQKPSPNTVPSKDHLPPVPPNHGEAATSPLRKETRTEQNENIEDSPVSVERRFSAPHTEWNPATQAPPPGTKPEAANFPSETYTMSSDKDLWKPPASYPDPPKNMWYEVPKIRTVESKPRPLFPWEENQAPPTRVFADEKTPPPHLPTAPKPVMPSEPGSEGSLSLPPPRASRLATTTCHPEDEDRSSPKIVPFSEYKGSNAWDDDADIGRYVSALLQSRRKGGMQILLPQNVSEFGTGNRRERRGSTKITEFPTEIERPSLPVTPAPIRRTIFWGSERDSERSLPEAEGVPAQIEWDPEKQLEKLRRNSLLFSSSSPTAVSDPPRREHPQSSKTPSSSQNIDTFER